MKSRLASTRPSHNRSVASTHSQLSEQKELDQEYLQLREVILNTEFYLTTTRHNRIRLNLWSQKLDCILTDFPSKRNRNRYIKLMYLMTEADALVQPFATLPPEGDMPSLRNYEINAIVDLVESKVNEKIAKYGYCRHCQKQEKERSIPFRLSTARIHIDEKYSYIDSLAQCSHTCNRHLAKTPPNGKVFINNDSKAAVDFPSSEHEKEGYIMCEQDEKENEGGNKLRTTSLNNTNRQTAHTVLQDSKQINMPHHTRHLADRQSEDSSDTQADLDQSVLVPSIRVFSNDPLTQHKF